MNICITGALGHIGSKLIRTVEIPTVKNIFLIDNFLTQRYASLFHLPANMPYQLCEMDILSANIEPIVEKSDVVIHLAAITDAEASVHNPGLVDEVNRKGLRYVAEVCARYNKKLLFFSTTSVYGVQTAEVDETCGDDVLKPQTPYATSKRAGEKLLQELAKTKGLNCVTLRMGTIFGFSIGMRFHTAVNKFIWQAVTGQEITVWKTALHQKRPYCGLNDCIQAILHVINNDLFNGELYNIVTTNLTVQNIIDEIKTFIPELKITFVDSPIMNQLSYTVSNKKSLQAGFRYQDTVRDCVRESISALEYVNHTVKKKHIG